MTKRMGVLELNQTLINNWLTLWQSQIAGRFKQFNATNNETGRTLRAVVSDLAHLSYVTNPYPKPNPNP